MALRALANPGVGVGGTLAGVTGKGRELVDECLHLVGVVFQGHDRASLLRRGLRSGEGEAADELDFTALDLRWVKWPCAFLLVGS